MVKRTPLLLCLLVALGLVLMAGAAAEDGVGQQRGKVELKSAGELAFAPDGVLLVADSIAGAIYAIDVEDQAKAEPAKALRVDAIDEKIAAALGTTAREVRINDMAAFRPSQAIYLSVSRGLGNDATPVIVRVAPDGSIDTVNLENRRYSRLLLNDAPDPSATDRRGRSRRALTITDMAYAEGQVWIAGLSNQEFASTLRRVGYPFSEEIAATSLEIYHGAHGAFETHAPIRTFVAHKIGGQPHLIASYTCTPLVTFPVSDLLDGEHVKGKTVAELGFGNSPLDMVTYEKNGEAFLLMLNNRRSAMKIKIDDIAKAPGITESEEAVSYGVDFIPLPFAGILHLDVLNDNNLIALRRDLDSGVLNLGTASMRFL